jgi:hypothetical protein
MVILSNEPGSASSDDKGKKRGGLGLKGRKVDSEGFQPWEESTSQADLDEVKLVPLSENRTTNWAESLVCKR